MGKSEDVRNPGHEVLVTMEDFFQEDSLQPNLDDLEEEMEDEF